MRGCYPIDSEGTVRLRPYIDARPLSGPGSACPFARSRAQDLDHRQVLNAVNRQHALRGLAYGIDQLDAMRSRSVLQGLLGPGLWP